MDTENNLRSSLLTTKEKNTDKEVISKQETGTDWASIEFQPNGTIITANHNFGKALGYDSIKDIEGKHHKIFCDSKFVESEEYKKFWENLACGNTQSGEFRRKTKNGSFVWIKASYTPIKNKYGAIEKVVKIASDITEMVESKIKAEAIQTALDATCATAEFNPEGEILNANEKYIQSIGYDNEEEIKKLNHSALCPLENKANQAYTELWKNLTDGKNSSGEFNYLKKDGSQIWFKATYTPIKNKNGVVFKIIKIASDITEMKNLIAKIDKIANLANKEGETSMRLDTSSLRNDYLPLSNSINNLIDSTTSPVNTIKGFLQAITEYKNDFFINGNISDILHLRRIEEKLYLLLEASDSSSTRNTNNLNNSSY